MAVKRPQYSIVQARIDTATKERAAEALADMGLSIPDAVRLFLTCVAEERCLPFLEKVPNAKTLRAIEELESDGAFSANTVDEFMAALNTED